MPVLIRWLHKLKFGQTEREEGLESHKKKSGTPTMGGLGFIVVPILLYLIGALLLNLPLNLTVLICLISYAGYGLIGWVDDYKIVVQKDNEGLKPGVKFLMQSVLAVLVYFLYIQTYPTTVWLPIFHVNLQVGFLYFIMIFLLFTGTSNAVNLTDGVDGLCAGQSIFVLVALAVIALLQNQTDVFDLAFLVIGSLIGYLRYNFYPAKVFMGDTGSLALGGLMAAMAMVLKVEILFILMAGVFVFETISVILQVFWFKRTGKRIFLMAPFHHHLEKKGFSEVAVVMRLWGVGLILALLSLILYIV